MTMEETGTQTPPWWRQEAPLKRQSTPRLRSAISQKALIFTNSKSKPRPVPIQQTKIYLE
jgi:hypothetical protein